MLTSLTRNGRHADLPVSIDKLSECPVIDTPSLVAASTQLQGHLNSQRKATVEQT
ncbi:Unknown protein sequence [Pseudomonas coronafaciens pv. oryzae]|nr:Unknown protein sequence [Pseudomonas coronafaciens pv. oryzae]